MEVSNEFENSHDPKYPNKSNHFSRFSDDFGIFHFIYDDRDEKWDDCKFEFGASVLHLSFLYALHLYMVKGTITCYYFFLHFMVIKNLCKYLEEEILAK